MKYPVGLNTMFVPDIWCSDYPDFVRKAITQYRGNLSDYSLIVFMVVKCMVTPTAITISSILITGGSMMKIIEASMVITTG